MTLFEQLKLFPKIDLHVDFLGSIPKDTLEKIIDDEQKYKEIEEKLEVNTLIDYETSKELIAKSLNSYKKIETSCDELLIKLKKDNLIYVELFVNLSYYDENLNKKEIIKTILKSINKNDIEANIVLEIDSKIKKEDMYNNLDILYEFYKKGIVSVCFKKEKQENLDTYQALFNKFMKDNIDYIVLLDSKLTNQNKEIYYNAKRVIYNLLEWPGETFLTYIKDNNISLEFLITYQNYFNLYDDLTTHFLYDLYKENINIVLSTCDMTILDTDLLNEYCKLFNVFPFSLHDLVNIILNNLNTLNVSLEVKNRLIDEFREKVNELL